MRENAGSDGDDIGIARLLMATAAMKNQTDRFYTTAIVFAGRSVYTTLFEPPLPPIQWPSLVHERHGMLGLLLQLGYVPVVTFVIPKARSKIRACFADKTVVRGRFLV